MDVRARPHRSQVERIRRIQDLGLGGGGLLGQMSEDEQKVVHKLLNMEGRRWMLRDVVTHPCVQVTNSFFV